MSLKVNGSLTGICSREERSNTCFRSWLSLV